MNLEVHKNNLKFVESCPYCGSSVIYIDSIKIFRKSYGMMYLCNNYPLCDASVGVHKGTNYPLGRMANKNLRYWKKRAHFYFDPIWQKKLDKNPLEKKNTIRNETYKWLSEKMNIPIEECHIGFFNVEQCKQVINHCRQANEGTLRLFNF